MQRGDAFFGGSSPTFAWALAGLLESPKRLSCEAVDGLQRNLGAGRGRGKRFDEPFGRLCEVAPAQVVRERPTTLDERHDCEHGSVGVRVVAIRRVTAELERPAVDTPVEKD